MAREMDREGIARETQAVLEIGASGSIIEALAGIGAIVLGILGLVGIVPTVLAAVATIVVGAALVVQGAGMVARYARLISGAGTPVQVETASSGLSVEILGGVAGIILGILALINIHSLPLMAVATIAFGGTLLLSAGMVSGLSAAGVGGNEPVAAASRQASIAGAGTQALIGGAGAVLGIIALVRPTHTLGLILVAMIAFGAAILLAGTAASTLMMSMLRR